MPHNPSFAPDFATPSQWAEMYRALGLQVVPAKSHYEAPINWKRPALSQWHEHQHERASDEIFDRWFGEKGEHVRRKNMGLVTGACSRSVFVIDLDYHTKTEARTWWQSLLAEYNNGGDLETPRQTTGGGGAQLLFRAPVGWMPPTCKTGIGVDIRGQGGFAMLPPSMHESGRPYRWDDNAEPWTIDIAEAPKWLCDEIDRLAGVNGRTTSSSPTEPMNTVCSMDAFGFTIDGREQKIRDMVWARLVSLRRDRTTRPTEEILAEEFEDLLASYLRNTKTRIRGVGNVQGLEQEGRGPTAFKECWHRTLKKWDTDITEAAEQSAPGHQGYALSEVERDGQVTAAERWLEAAPRKVRSSVHLLRAADIVPEQISWLWPGFLAEGKMHILAGAPGSGKTTIALRLAAIVSAGGSWPDGSHCPAGNVVIWSGEDDIRDTLVPRLIAAGADTNRIRFVGDVREAGSERSFDLAKDVPALKDAIQSVGGASLMIVDPIVSAVAGDGHKAGDVRRGLQPLVDLAMAERCALFGITHFSKGTSGNDPLERVTGSVSFGALARVVFVAAKEQEGETGDLEVQPRRIFLRCKSNIGSDSGGFEYTLKQKSLDGFDGIFASVATFGCFLEGNTKAILAETEADPNGDDGGALSEAKAWLFDFLLDGPRAAKEVKKAAADAGHTDRTLRRAKGALGVSARKSGLKGGWEWFNPGAVSELPKGGQEGLKEASAHEAAPFGNVGPLLDDDQPSSF